MTDTSTAATITAPAGWHLLPRRNDDWPAFYVDDLKVFFSNKLNPAEWDEDALATLIGDSSTSKLSSVHERRIFLVFPDTPLAHLDGFSLSQILAKLATDTGCYITLATYHRDIAQGLGGVVDGIRRRTVTYNNDSRNMNQPGVLIELCTQEFFLEHTNYNKTAPENEHLRWHALYRLMSAFTADGVYSSNPAEVLQRGLFHREQFTGSNKLVVVRRGRYGIEMTPYPVHNVTRRG